MQVKVDIETMTLKIVDCDPFEGSIMDMANGKVIEVVLVDSSTSEDHMNDFDRGEEEMGRVGKHKVSLNLQDLLNATEQQKN